MAKRPCRATDFVNQLSAAKSKKELANVQRHYKGPNEGNQILGVRMGSIFKLAREFIDLPLTEIEELLDSRYFEVRMGGVSVMDFQARRKSTAHHQRKELYDLYLARHDRINNWDLVDRSAPYVVGGYLHDKSRKPLYKLAKSRDPWRRRTAIVSTYFFIRQNDTDDTFAIAEILVNDDHRYVQKAVGSWLREAGKRAPPRLLSFVEKYAATMARETLRLAIEKMDKSTRDKMLNTKAAKTAKTVRKKK